MISVCTFQKDLYVCILQWDGWKIILGQTIHWSGTCNVGHFCHIPSSMALITYLDVIPWRPHIFVFENNQQWQTVHWDGNNPLISFSILKVWKFYGIRSNYLGVESTAKRTLRPNWPNPKRSGLGESIPHYNAIQLQPIFALSSASSLAELRMCFTSNFKASPSDYLFILVRNPTLSFGPSPLFEVPNHLFPL